MKKSDGTYCEVARCKNLSDLQYYGRGVCRDHYIQHANEPFLKAEFEIEEKEEQGVS